MNNVQSNSASSSYQIRIVLYTLFAVIVADGIITVFLVQNGLAAEGNPFLSYWVGREAFLAFKAVGGLLAALYLYFFHKRHPRLAIWFSSLCLFAYTVILLWNLSIILRW